jgi:putative colanic acid biosynthesis UDP-glucose lipid carrier transferase
MVKVASDFALICICFYVSLILCQLKTDLTLSFPHVRAIYVVFLVAMCLSWYISARMTGLYDEFRSRSRVFEVQALAKNCVALFLVSIFFIFVFKIEPINQFLIVVFLFSTFVALVIWKILFASIMRLLRRKGHNLRNVLLVGFSRNSLKFVDNLVEHPYLGYRIVGFLDDVDHSDDFCAVYLGPLAQLETELGKGEVDEVLIAMDKTPEDKILEIVETCEQFPVMVRMVPGSFNYLSSRCSISLFRDFPVITIRRNPLDELQWRFIKRAFDIAFSICFLVLVASWMFPLLSIIIRLTSLGPVFFRQERWGKKNKRIICYKFRSMFLEKSAEGALPFRQATPADSRVTPIGRILRKTNLDELPQFVNVLLGEMSVVGPRPHPTPLNIQSSGEINKYLLRHIIKPGITGWAQIHGFRGNTGNHELMQKRVEHDIWYIENWTFLLDMHIIILTLLNMLKKDGNAY